MDFRRNTGNLACSGSKNCGHFLINYSKEPGAIYLYDVDDFKTLARSLINRLFKQNN